MRHVIHRRYVMSLVDQAAGALLAFGVNLWLIRTGAGAAYGVFVFWYAGAIMASTLVGALTMAHLLPLSPRPQDRLARREPERVLLSITLAMTALLTLGVGAAAGLLGCVGSSVGQPAAALFVGGFVLAQYTRTLVFSRGRVAPAMAMTLAVLGVVIAGFLLDHLAGATETAERVLALVGVAYGLCGALVLWLMSRGVRPRLDRATWRAYLPMLRRSGWLVLGAMSGELAGRLFNFVVAGQYGPAALGRLSAPQVAVRPAWLLVGAWSGVARARISTQNAAGDRRGVLETMARGAAVTAAGSLAWGLVVIAAWPLIAGRVFGGRYEDAVGLAALWMVNAVVGSVALSLNTALMALGTFRPLAYADVAGAVVSGVLTLALVPTLGLGGAIVAIIAGQLTQTALMLMLMVRYAGRPAPARPMVEAAETVA